MGEIKLIRLKAATLVETIVALVIILVLFGIVTGFLVQVSLHSFSAQHTKAAQLINNYAIETNDTKSFFDEQIERENMLVKRDVITNETASPLVHIKFRVYNKSGKLIAAKQKLFFLQ